MSNQLVQTLFFTFIFGLKVLCAKKNENEFYNPRDEIYLLRTSGEESKRLKYRKFDFSKFDHNLVADEEKLPQRNQISRKRLDFSRNTNKRNNEKMYATTRLCSYIQKCIFTVLC